VVTVQPTGVRNAALPVGAQGFKSESEWARLAANWPVSRLVEIWNHLPGVRPIQKFTNRKSAIRRIWSAIQKLHPERTARKRPSSKREQILVLLSQPSGASLTTIMKTTGWQAHSVRGFISGHVGRKMGLRVKSFRRDGERVYAIER